MLLESQRKLAKKLGLDQIHVEKMFKVIFANSKKIQKAQKRTKKQ